MAAPSLVGSNPSYPKLQGLEGGIALAEAVSKDLGSRGQQALFLVLAGGYVTIDLSWRETNKGFCEVIEHVAIKRFKLLDNMRKATTPSSLSEEERYCLEKLTKYVSGLEASFPRSVKNFTTQFFSQVDVLASIFVTDHGKGKVIDTSVTCRISYVFLGLFKKGQYFIEPSTLEGRSFDLSTSGKPPMIPDLPQIEPLIKALATLDRVNQEAIVKMKMAINRAAPLFAILCNTPEAILAWMRDHQEECLAIEYIDCSNANLEVIPEEFLSYLPNLKDLNLSNNKLKLVSKSSFATLTNLENLNLSKNQIQLIEKDAFAAQNQLISLCLNENPALRNLGR